MQNILTEVRELLKNKTLKEQLEIMFKMRKKYFNLNHLEWFIIDTLEGGKAYYVRVEEDSVDGCYDEYDVWEYEYTKEDVEKIIFRYLAHYKYGYPMNRIFKWYLKNK